jgi:hypothetical protein
LIVANTRGCYFGRVVGLSGDGLTALVGAPSNGNDLTGSAWIFTHRNKGNAWRAAPSALAANDETGDGGFGTSVTLSGDGATALIGGSGDNSAEGAAWAFARTGAPCVYPAQVQSSSGLLGYWRLGESSGSTAVDATGQHNGTYAGGVSLGAPGAILGNPNTSVALDGASGRVALPHLGSASDWTIEGWTNLSSTAPSNPNGNNSLYAANRGVRIIIRPSGFFLDDSTTGTSLGSKNGVTDPNIGVWVFWAVVRSGPTLTIYRNGEVVGMSSLGSEGPSALDGAIGAEAGSNLPYDLHGRVDEFAIYGSALGAGAISPQYTCAGWG